MDLYEALYTTRAMRRVSSEPVSEEAIAQILDAAIRAPSGGNAQNWRMIVVSDPDLREQIAPLYRAAYEELQATIYKGRRQKALESGEEASLRVMRSSDWLGENAGQVPVWILFFSRNDPSGASIYPAVWNGMLAARGLGLGTCLTTVLGIFKSPEMFELFDVPSDKGWVLNAAVTCGHPLGNWGVAQRAPAEEVTYGQRWGKDLGFAVDGPLWP